MDIESLPEWLSAIGVPQELVSIGEAIEQRWCVVSHTDGFEVFWLEQGNRYDWALFADAQVAAFYLFGRLSWSQVVRGTLVPLTEKSDAV